MATFRNFHTHFSEKRHFLGSFQGLTSEILCFVPKRSFGQGQKIRIFGHAKKKSASKYPDIWPLLIGIPAFALAFSIVDLAEFERRGYSIPNPFNLYKDFQQWKNTYNGVDQTNVYDARRKKEEPIALYSAVAENKEEFHKAMMQEAMKRHQKEVTALAEEDPILRALLKNKTIDESQFKNEDKEIFEAKKKWVEQYKQTLQEAEKVGVEFETTEKKFWLFDSEKRSEKWENLKNNYTFWPEDDKAKKYKRISS